MPCIRNVGEVRPKLFLYVPAVSNVVTTGNGGTGTKNVLKWNCALRFVLSIQSSVYVATTIAIAHKPILYMDTVNCKFTLCKRRDRPL